MRAVVQRVTRAEVAVQDTVISRIGQGLLVLLGVMKGDTDDDARYMIDKITGLRIFEDDEEKMNRSLVDIGGSLMIVSQFTLAGDARKGRRPSFSDAEHPERAEHMIEAMVREFQDRGLTVATGQFGANMQVHLVNDGPVTILLDSRRTF